MSRCDRHRTSVSAPSTQQVSDTRNFVENKSGIPLPKNWSQIWSSEIENNYVAVDIVCETSRVETFTQDASMSPVDLLSNIGGQTGLWIGISFLSIMEFIEMLYRLIRYQCYILKKRIRNKNDE